MLSADTKQLRRLAAELRRTKRTVYRNTQKALRAEAEKIAERARENASWSSRIPGTIKATVSGVNTVKVKAGDPEKAPHAAPIEHGGAPGTFRHPYFGKWVEDEKPQQARPFLHPAATRELAETVVALGVAVTAAAEEAVSVNGI